MDISFRVRVSIHPVGSSRAGKSSQNHALSCRNRPFRDGHHIFGSVLVKQPLDSGGLHHRANVAVGYLVGAGPMAGAEFAARASL
jgi:hypothetical protein